MLDAVDMSGVHEGFHPQGRADFPVRCPGGDQNVHLDRLLRTPALKGQRNDAHANPLRSFNGHATQAMANAVAVQLGSEQCTGRIDQALQMQAETANLAVVHAKGREVSVVELRKGRKFADSMP